MNASVLYFLGLSALVQHLDAATATNEVFLSRVLSIQAHDPRERVGSLAFSPDNKILASGTGVAASTGSHGEIKLWNTSNGQFVAELKGHGGLVDGLAFSPDGKFIAGGGYKLILWDVAKRKKVKTMNPESLVHSVTFAPDGKTIVSACRGQPFAQVWDARTGREQKKLHVGDDREHTVYSVDFSPDGAFVAIGGGNQPATLWNSKTWLLDSAFTNTVGASGVAKYVKFSPDGRLLFIRGDISGQLWNVAERKVVLQLQGDEDLVDNVDFSPDGVFIATAGMDRLNLWEAKTGRRVQSIKGNFWSVAFSPNCKLLAVGVYGGSIQVFRVTGAESVRKPE